MYGDIWQIYAQYLQDHWNKDIGQRDAIKFQLLRINRWDCAVHITVNMSLCPMCSNFDEGTAEDQMVCCTLDLLGTVAEWDNSGVRVTIIIQAVSYLF